MIFQIQTIVPHSSSPKVRIHLTEQNASNPFPNFLNVLTISAVLMYRLSTRTHDEVLAASLYNIQKDKLHVSRVHVLLLEGRIEEVGGSRGKPD